MIFFEYLTYPKPMIEMKMLKKLNTQPELAREFFISSNHPKIKHINYEYWGRLISRGERQIVYLNGFDEKQNLNPSNELKKAFNFI